MMPYFILISIIKIFFVTTQKLEHNTQKPTKHYAMIRWRSRAQLWVHWMALWFSGLELVPQYIQQFHLKRWNQSYFKLLYNIVLVLVKLLELTVFSDNSTKRMTWWADAWFNQTEKNKRKMKTQTILAKSIAARN